MEGEDRKALYEMSISEEQVRQANKDASPFLCCFVVVVAVVVVVVVAVDWMHMNIV